MPGWSAAAPFVLHIAVVSLFFDIVRHEIRTRVHDGTAGATVLAWGALLVYLAAQGSGALWTHDLLIEQPQIYMIAGCAFLIYVMAAHGTPRRTAVILAGLAVMGGYLLKSAMLTVVPGLLLAVILDAARSGNRPGNHWAKGALADLLWLLLPTLTMMVLWSRIAPAGEGCLASPLKTLSADSVAAAAAQDWRGLAGRFTAAVLDYSVRYKTPVLIGAALGTGLAMWTGRMRAFVFLAAFALLYLGALYWYHLTCFGPYYFENLNSIERFSRVALQPFHAVGLLALTIGSLSLCTPKFLDTLVTDRRVLGFTVVVCLVLAGWQLREVSRSVNDVTTRAYQSVDRAVTEVRHLADFVRRSYSEKERVPLVQFINQGKDRDILGYAQYYALDAVKGKPRSLFRYAPNVSWSKTPTNIWQAKSDNDALLRAFGQADIIWPVSLDPWISAFLADLSNGAPCTAPLIDSVLVKGADGTFSCRSKASQTE